MFLRFAPLALAGLLGWTSLSGAQTPNEVRVLTYNVLADPVRPAERAADLSRIMQDARADIIALQEVVPWFTDRLLREPWTKGYHRARQDGRTVIAHEYVILSRFPLLNFHTEALPGIQGRVLHRISVDLDGVPTAIATCHLESLLKDGPVRAQQLDAYAADLTAFPEALLLGDFNFGDGEQPDSDHLPAGFVDAWLVVHPGQPGYTWDIERSAMARRESLPGEGSRRLDRVLLKSGRWTPVGAIIVGDQPLGTPGKRMYPSDHFGVLAVFRRSGPSEGLADLVLPER